ncbi:hypothetical protein [Gemmata massiliana]|uniref:hypothetical protein n=1 Tax=Gemmata massiliana TaxID=1210884 RepID=UPI0013A68C40|nr:hypothetical protein [Gemmata massiliana]
MQRARGRGAARGVPSEVWELSVQAPHDPGRCHGAVQELPPVRAGEVVVGPAESDEAGVAAVAE